MPMEQKFHHKKQLISLFAGASETLWCPISLHYFFYYFLIPSCMVRKYTQKPFLIIWKSRFRENFCFEQGGVIPSAFFQIAPKFVARRLFQIRIVFRKLHFLRDVWSTKNRGLSQFFGICGKKYHVKSFQ